MSIYKKVMLPILSLIILLSQITHAFAMASGQTSQAEVFTDIKSSDWFYKDVMKASQDGLVKGIGHGLYNPSGTITYGQFITTLVRVYKSDGEISSVANSTHWSDKYIAEARKLGTFSKGEVITPDKEISRQEMIRYTVNLLGLQPSESTSIIFADVKAADAKYIDIAYKEYLTEGSGRNTEGLKVFGFNKTSLRSEMSAMVNRVKAYKANPAAFKAEKAAARATADAAYAAEQANYTMWNGYKIPNDFKNIQKSDTCDLYTFARYDTHVARKADIY